MVGDGDDHDGLAQTLREEIEGQGATQRRSQYHVFASRGSPGRRNHLLNQGVVHTGASRRITASPHDLGDLRVSEASLHVRVLPDDMVALPADVLLHQVLHVARVVPLHQAHPHGGRGRGWDDVAGQRAGITAGEAPDGKGGEEEPLRETLPPALRAYQTELPSDLVVVVGELGKSLLLQLTHRLRRGVESLDEDVAVLILHCGEEVGQHLTGYRRPVSVVSAVEGT